MDMSTPWNKDLALSSFDLYYSNTTGTTGTENGIPQILPMVLIFTGIIIVVLVIATWFRKLR